MLRYIKTSLFIIVITVFTNTCFSQEGNYLLQNKDVFGKRLKIHMLNDCNPAINQLSNDTGHTLGCIYEFNFFNKKKPFFYEIALESNLYTKDANIEYKDAEGRTISAQYFTEISSVNFTINKYLERKKIFIDLKTYLGIYNREKAIYGMTLYMQGGKDGKGGYHKLLDDNPGQENIETGKLRPLIYIEPGIKKYFIGKVVTKHDNAFIYFHAGTKLGYPFKGMSVFANAYGELPIMQLSYNKTNIFKVNFCYQHELALHTDGLMYIPEIGVELSALFLSLGYTSNFFYGKRNVSMTNYIDNEQIMRLYLKIKMFDMFIKRQKS